MVNVETSVGQVAFAVSEVSFLVLPNQRNFPSTPLTATNLFQTTTNVHERSDASVVGGEAYSSLLAGQLTSVLTSTSGSLVTLLPHLYKMAQFSLPIVVHMANHKNHEDLMAIRDCGVVLISSLNKEEAQEMAFLAHYVAMQAQIPFVHFYDGGFEQDVSLMPYEQLAKLVGEEEQLQRIEAFRKTKHTEEAVQENELFYQLPQEHRTRFAQVADGVSEAMVKFFPQRQYQLFEYFGHPQAEIVIVLTGTGSGVVKETVEMMHSNWGARVGVVCVRLVRPWSTAQFLKQLPETVVKIAVLEKLDDPRNIGEPLYFDVLQSVQSSGKYIKCMPTIIGAKFDENMDVIGVRKALEDLQANNVSHGFTVLSSSTTSKDESTIVTKNNIQQTPATDNIEKPYIHMLKSLFGNRTVCANLMGESSIHGDSSDLVTENAEFGYGVHLALLEKRRQLFEKVSNLIDENKSSKLLSSRLISVFADWMKNFEDSEVSESLSEEINTLFGAEYEAKKGLSSLLDDIYNSRSSLLKPSQWMIGSDEWCNDVGESGLHQVISSGENINLIILDTQPYSTIQHHSKNAKKKRKRDIGLYAMQYGDTYVASVALYDSYSHVLRALKEADEFKGPSIVLAYAPTSSTENPSSVSMEEETKSAVNSCYWPLYRWNPSLPEEDKRFHLESLQIKKELKNFLQRENQLSIFSKQIASSAGSEKSVADITQSNLMSSFAKLYSNLSSDVPSLNINLKICIGSDNGNAEEMALKIASECESFGINVSTMDMNEFEVGSASDYENVLFVCSTAGQGEFPVNAKEMWTELTKLTPSSDFSSVKYAVFGLGDSNYWPREDERHYFCKAPKDLDKKLNELGFSDLVEVGLGDDQDADGPETALESWKPQFYAALGVPEDILSQMNTEKVKVTNEDIKSGSNFLRGTLETGLVDRSTASLCESDTQLTKFHGIYQQDNRDEREARRAAKMEKAFSFMIRVRVPGGISSAKQYIAMHDLCEKYANGNIKLTTRQAYQLQGILKWDLKDTVKGINRALMDSLAACGDVNRNVMASVLPEPNQTHIHEEVLEIAKNISEHLTPKTSAYHEIWLDKKLVAGGEVKDFEPIYGEAYLPRKFKISIAVPPSNDVDVFADCLGFIAILGKDEVTNKSKLLGFNVTVGGGMGMTHNNTKTFPRVADVMAFCTIDQVVEVSEKVVTVQRDYGDRINRKHARFKYTVEDHGLKWIRDEVEKRLGYKLGEPRPYEFKFNGDKFGWHKGERGKMHYTMFVEGGRIVDTPDYQLKTALREIAEIHDGDFRLTGNQNLVLGNVSKAKKPAIIEILRRYKVDNEQYSSLRLNSIACAALPFCGLALAESERYLPSLITRLDTILEDNGLRNDAIIIRMTGCPNGCGRPYLGEIGFVGRAPGIYNLYLGAGFTGDRLNKLYKEALDEEAIIEALTPIISHYAKERELDEKFGDFVIRKDYVKACDSRPNIDIRAAGETFHA